MLKPIQLVQVTIRDTHEFPVTARRRDDTAVGGILCGKGIGSA